MDQAKDTMRARRVDWPLMVLSASLLLAMVLASLYGFRYGNVDESVVPGSVSIIQDNHEVLSIEIDNDFNATIAFRDVVMRGHLGLYGAEEDSILYRLTDREYIDYGEDAELEGVELDPDQSVLLVRMPRSGTQGSLSGPWMAYYSYIPSATIRSSWILAYDDGTALVGADTIANPMTAQRKQLEKAARKTTWQKDGSRVIVG